MALIGNDFTLELASYPFRCGECRVKVAKGEMCLVSRRFGKVQKRLCAKESCRQSFDDAYWQERARQSEREGRL